MSAARGDSPQNAVSWLVDCLDSRLGFECDCGAGSDPVIGITVALDKDDLRGKRKKSLFPVWG